MYNKMQVLNRHGKRWNINELLSLQREYELLEWTVQEIADKHQRTVNSILFKLESEGFIGSWNEARGFDPVVYQKKFESSYEEDEDDDESEFDDQYDDEDYVEEEEEEDDDYVDTEDYEDEVSEVSKLADRVWSLETSVNDISGMVKQIFDSLINKKPNNVSNKRPLSSSV
jgi:hypothetical protein